MTKEIVYFDKQSFNLAVTRIEKAKDLLQAAVDEFKKLELGDLETSDLEILVPSSRELLESKVLAKIEADMPSYGGFKINKAAFLKQLTLPFDPVFFHNACKDAYTHFNNFKIQFSYFLLKNGSVQINQKEIQRLKDGHTVYADCENSSACHNEFKNFLESYARFNQFLIGLGMIDYTGGKFNPGMWFKFDQEGNMVINPDIFQQVLKSHKKVNHK